MGKPLLYNNKKNINFIKYIRMVNTNYVNKFKKKCVNNNLKRYKNICDVLSEEPVRTLKMVL